MDKPPKKKLSRTPRETFSLDKESLEIIRSEQEGHDYKPSKSAVIRLALQLLKREREKLKAKSQQVKQSAIGDFKSAANAIKPRKGKAE